MGREDLMVRNAVRSWKQVVRQVDKTIGAFGDEELQREVAPGRNRVYYLLGHLTAVHDRMFSTVRIGERLPPELDVAFIVKADKRDLDDEVPAGELAAGVARSEREGDGGDGKIVGGRMAGAA
jgi:hypothetical protein